MIRIRISWPNKGISVVRPTRFVPIETVQVLRCSLNRARGSPHRWSGRVWIVTDRGQAAAAYFGQDRRRRRLDQGVSGTVCREDFRGKLRSVLLRTPSSKTIRLLEDAGLANQFAGQATSAQCGTPYPESLRVIGITLTPKGVAQQWPEHNELGGGWDLVMGRRELVEVTAIVSESDLARAEYTWRLVPTVAEKRSAKSSLQQQRASATFRRQDGGWQLIRIDARPPGLREPLQRVTTPLGPACPELAQDCSSGPQRRVQSTAPGCPRFLVEESL